MAEQVPSRTVTLARPIEDRLSSSLPYLDRSRLGKDNLTGHVEGILLVDPLIDPLTRTRTGRPRKVSSQLTSCPALVSPNVIIDGADYRGSATPSYFRRRKNARFWTACLRGLAAHNCGVYRVSICLHLGTTDFCLCLLCSALNSNPVHMI